MTEQTFGRVEFYGAVAMMWAAAVLYLFPLKRRRRWGLRVAACFAISPVMAEILNLLPQLSIFCRIVFCYAFLVCMLLFCGSIRWSTACYCGIWALMTQQLTIELALLIRVAGEAALLSDAGWLIVFGLFFLMSYCILGLTVARFMPERGQYHVGPRQLISAWGMLVLFEILFYTLFVKHSFPPEKTSWGAAIFSQFYCATVFYLQNELFKKSSMRKELDTLKLLQHQQKEQYELAKENIALINRKCHDLKHQMAAMRRMGDVQDKEKYLQEIEDSVRIYDCMIQTGNEVLDTILTEKSLVCEANHITIQCVADGKRLSFIDPVDICTMFGNALDNAIEGVSRIEEEEKRLIDVLIHKKDQFLVISITNPLKEKLAFEEDLPMTTKEKNGYHGFGLKSIRYTAEKYDGAMAVDTSDGTFSLRIVIPHDFEE